MALPIWVLVLVAVIAIAVLKIVHLLWSLRYIARCLKQIPLGLNKPAHWLYGSLNHMSKSEYYLEKAIWGSKNGIRISIEWWGPFLPAIIIHHPDVWKEVINKPKSDQIYEALLGPWLGNGLLISKGERWVRNRKLLTAAFHFETLKPYIRIYNECNNVLVKKWTESIVNGQAIPVYGDISKMALDILLKCSFSYDSNCQIEDVPYTRAIRQLSVFFIERHFSPIYRSVPNSIYLNVVPHGRRFKKAYNYIQAYADNVIAERKKSLSQLQAADSTVSSKELMARALQKDDRKCLDFLDILLMARDEEGNGLTNLEIRYEVDTFMFEGHDTTAHAISWTLYCLAEHPEHQERCREEINEVFGTKDNLDHDDLAELKYTQWCIKESMRMYPTVYQFVREIQEDTMIDGHMIPKGTQVGVSVTNLHHNKEFWSDPEVFDPLRFHPDKISKQHPYAYLAFSAGPRNCIGQNFAMNEMRVVIGSILRKFKLSLIEGKKVVAFPNVLYGFKNDLPLKIENV